ncbi:hypothetical protein KVR01_013609 [Diaporthe batatas]|uniref:uncharacterized protein n=1 Tax=Diaporthe batatas TaxID=748121 RepID=UPI001D04C6E9|nr:uncharacterized protein KVR01_013609 [Diaporthe batatas]KAG8156505.1 hypothetical protein KVR01_013609 [Diaporthe batatas]
MVSVHSLYTVVLAISTMLPQAAAHGRSANPGVPVIDARLVDVSGRPLNHKEIADLSGRTVELTVKNHNGPSATKRSELDDRALILVALYIAAASGEDDAQAYADDLEGAE